MLCLLTGCSQQEDLTATDQMDKQSRQLIETEDRQVIDYITELEDRQAEGSYKQGELAMRHKEDVEQLFRDYTKTSQLQGQMGKGIELGSYEIGEWTDVVRSEVVGMYESEHRIFYNVVVELKTKVNQSSNQDVSINVAMESEKAGGEGEVKTKEEVGKKKEVEEKEEELRDENILLASKETVDGPKLKESVSGNKGKLGSKGVSMIGSEDEIRVSCKYRVEIEKSEDFKVLKIIPDQDFDWMSSGELNGTCIQQLPYWEEVPQEFIECVGAHMQTWIERPEEAFQKEAVYLNPYKDDMAKLELVGYTMTCHESATLKRPVFNVALEMKVLLKNDKTVYYNYDYIVGLKDESIESIHFINAKPIDK